MLAASNHEDMAAAAFIATDGDHEASNSRNSGWSSVLPPVEEGQRPYNFNLEAIPGSSGAAQPAITPLYIPSRVPVDQYFGLPAGSQASSPTRGLDAHRVHFPPSLRRPDGRDIEQQPPVVVYGIGHANPFQRSRTTPPTIRERVLLWIFSVLIHELYEPFCHLLTFLQMVLIILQQVPDVNHVGRKWSRPHLIVHYFLVSVFAIYTFDVAARIAITRQIVPAYSISSHWVTSFQRVRSFEQLRRYVNTVFSTREDAIAEKAPSKTTRRAIMESYMDIFASTERRKQQAHHRQEVIMQCTIQEKVRIFFDGVVSASFWISLALANHGSRTDSIATVFSTISSFRLVTLLEMSKGTQV